MKRETEDEREKEKGIRQAERPESDADKDERREKGREYTY